jgi:N-methylhydantoinase A/oxoprolinase/acetone carboxylase beta subunit
MEKKANAQMDRDGIATARRRFQFSLDMRHRGQINEVEVMLPAKRMKTAFADALHRRFITRYEQLYGRGSSYGEARLEIVTMRLRATAATPRCCARKLSTRIAAKASLGKRTIYWADRRSRRRARSTREMGQSHRRPRSDRDHRYDCRGAPAPLAQGRCVR